MGTKLKRHLFYIALFLVVLSFPILDRNQYHVNIVIMIAISSIISIGLNLVLGNTGQASLGHAAFYGVGAYASAILSTKAGFPFWIALPCSAMISGIVGYIIGFSSIRLKGSHLAMATLSFGVIFSIIILEWTGVTGGAGGYPEIIPKPSIGRFKFDSEFKYYYLVLIFLVGAFIYAKNLVDSRIGRALFAVHEKEVVAGVIGINATKYKLKLFTLSAFYAGMAGSLYAHYASYISEETFSVFFSISLVCMIVIGGLGNVWGSIIGTFVLFLLSETIRNVAELKSLPRFVQAIMAEYSYHLILYGFVLAIFVIFMPNGIVGLFSKKKRG